MPAARARRLACAQHARKMLVLDGCVQPAMAPNINAAAARVLDALGVQLSVAPKAGCCGAVRHHLNDQEGRWTTCAATSTPGGRMSIAGERRGHRHDGVGLRRHRQGIRPPAGARRRLCGQGGAHQRADARPQRDHAGVRGGAAAQNRHQGTRRLSTRPARCSTASRSAARSKACCARPVSTWCCAPTATCAAARPARIRCCSRSWRCSCATASWPTWPRPAPGDRLGQRRLHRHLQSGTATPVMHWIELIDRALGAAVQNSAGSP
jgi:glycolate oxidase iron-sulfur subunit